MSLKRVLSFDLNRVLLFEVNRILKWDVGQALHWRVPPMLLKGLAGWFLAAIALDVMGKWQGFGAAFLAAASAGAFVLPDLVRRMRAQR